MNTNIVVNVIGWAGSVAVILAYALVSTRRVKGDSFPYQALNLVGGLFLIVNTLYYGAYPSSFVNLVWVGIATFALVRGARHH